MEHMQFAPTGIPISVGKDILQTAQGCYTLKIQSFFKCQTIMDGIGASQLTRMVMGWYAAFV